MLSFLRILILQIIQPIRRIFIVAVVFMTVIGLFIAWSKPSHKATTSQDSLLYAREQKLINSFDQPLYKTQEGKFVANIQMKLSCSLVGSLCSKNPSDFEKNFPKSLFGSVSKLVVLPLAQPPASGVAYIYNTINEGGFIPKSFAAQGIGFTSLSPFLPVWEAFRNMSFMIIVLIIIALGFMIMFQYKIDSHTVLSVQNALPRIIFTLLAITFSYAIAGLLIDATYLIILLIFKIFSLSGLNSMNVDSLTRNYLTSNILSFTGSAEFNFLTTGLYMKTLYNIYYLLPGWLQLIIAGILTFASNQIVLRLSNQQFELANVLAGKGKINLGALGSANAEIELLPLLATLGVIFTNFAIVNIIILLGFLLLAVIGVLFLFARIVFLLIGAYIQIVVHLILAPLFLLKGAMPGQDGISAWVKTIFGNLLTFPTVITLLLIVQVIQGVGGGSSDVQGFSLPLLYGFDSEVLSVLVSGALMFLIPDLTKQVVKSVAGESSIKAGPGTLFGGAAVLAGSAMGIASNIHTLSKLAGNEKGAMPGYEWVKEKITNRFKKKSGDGAHG